MADQSVGTSRGASAPRLSIQTEPFPRSTRRGILSQRAGRMARITFDVPESALSAQRLSPNEFVRELRVAAALFSYSQGEISQSVGAAIAGVSRAEFIDQLSRHRIPVVQTTADELDDEIRSE